MPNIPNPKYDYNTEKIVKVYKKTINDILTTLDRIDISNMTRANTAATLTEVAKILASINEESAQWVAENIPIAARDGVLSALVSLDVKDAEKATSFNKMNRGMVEAVIADTQSDLLAVTQNVERRVRSAVRLITSESMRANMARGVNGRKTISSDILAGLKKKLSDSVNTGIIDAAGRCWKPEVYVDMITRTKTQEARNYAMINESIARGALYGVISRHGANDACRFHEGRIIKLTAEAPGPYPTYDELRSTGQIFHPCCRHVFTPVRDPTLVAKREVISTGGRQVYRPSDPKTIRELEKLDAESDKMYERIRNTDEDVPLISQNTGWDIESISQIKQHVFIDKHNFVDGRFERFFPDYEIALGWQRLVDGNFYDFDIVLLNHEYLESSIMKNNGNLYEPAHFESNKKYDWSAEIERLKKEV